MRAFRHVEVLHESPAVSIGASGPLLVVQFRNEVSLAALRSAESAQAKLYAKHPGGLLLLTVINAGVPLPSDGSRQMVADTFRTMAARNVAAATAILGDGFWASAIRSTLTALNLIVRPPCPQKTFATIDESLAWLATFETGQKLDARAVSQDVSSFCAPH